MVVNDSLLWRTRESERPPLRGESQRVGSMPLVDESVRNVDRSGDDCGETLSEEFRRRESIQKGMNRRKYSGIVENPFIIVNNKVEYALYRC